MSNKEGWSNMFNVTSLDQNTYEDIRDMPKWVQKERREGLEQEKEEQ